MLLPLFLAINIAWSAPGLTPAQKAWCERFARESVAMTNGDAATAIEQMQRSAAEARAAGLPLVAEYLERAARGDGLETERALQASAHGPVIAIVRLRQPSNGESPFADISLGVRDRDDAWLAAFEQPRGAHAIMNLVAHAGTAAQSTAPAAYLPFDNSLRDAAGRSVIVWKNMTVANWYERELRPVADVLNAGATSGEALARWYARRFLVTVPNKTALGDQWAPLAVATQDVTAVLALPGELPTFLAVTFQTLNDTIRGEAPQQHRPATCLVLNWCMRHGGLTTSSGRWRIHRRAMLRSLRSLTRELGDAQRGAKLLAEYGAVTPAIQATLDRLPPPNAPKTDVHFAIVEEQ